MHAERPSMPNTANAAAPTLIERITHLEELLSDTNQRLAWAHDRVSFLESATGTAAPQQPVPLPKGY